jgi:hypothetical protein
MRINSNLLVVINLLNSLFLQQKNECVHPEATSTEEHSRRTFLSNSTSFEGICPTFQSSDHKLSNEIKILKLI